METKTTNLITCKDWKETLEAIKESKKILNNKRHDEKDYKVWYRGQSNSNFKLIPTLHRREQGLALEKSVFNKFKQLDRSFGESSLDDWEMLYKMQHYGIPTRLLDWSEVPGVSLFFASKYNQAFEPNQSICLYVLDPLKMNKKTYPLHQKVITLPNPNNNDDLIHGLEYVKTYLNKSDKNNQPEYPIAIYPNKYNSGRILAQSGVFTIHPNKNEPIESLCPDCIVKIVIESQAVPEIVEVLDLTNVNEMTIYPDMQGVAEYFKTMLYKKV